jgi:PPP family 3-phenylpropionic acid transporter
MIPSAPLLDGITIKATERVNRSYGSIRLWGSIGFTVIAIGSPYVMDQLGGIENLKYIYWVVWIPALTCLFFLKDEPSNGRQITISAIHSLAKNKMFIWFLLMVFIIMIPHRMNDNFFGLHLSGLGASDSMVGWAWAIAAFSEVPAFALLGKYMHRFNELALLGLAALLYCIRWIIFAYVTDPWVLTFLAASASITFGVFWIVAVTYAVRLVPEHLRSTGQSFLSAVFLGLAGITGGTVGGWINGSYGGEGMYLFGAVLAGIASALFFYTNMRERKKG